MARSLALRGPRMGLLMPFLSATDPSDDSEGFLFLERTNAGKTNYTMFGCR